MCKPYFKRKKKKTKKENASVAKFPWKWHQYLKWVISVPLYGPMSPKPGRGLPPYLSMLMAQRFRMLAVHIMTSRVTKTSQQTRLKFQTPPVTWPLETRRMLVFSPGRNSNPINSLAFPKMLIIDANAPSWLPTVGAISTRGLTGTEGMPGCLGLIDKEGMGQSARATRDLQD